MSVTKSKVDEVKVDPASKAVAALQKAQQKREIKYANRFVVYGYKTDKFFTPNLLVLPKSSEAANPFFVAENVKAAQKNGKFKIPSDLVLVRVGEFNLQSGAFTSLCHKVVFDFAKDFKEDK